LADRGSPADKDREEALDSLRATYQQYTSTGYARRWSTRTPGMTLAIAERDAWLAEAIGQVDTLVDIGCGSGSLGSLLDERGLRPQRYVGVDLLEERVDAARSAVPWGEFIAASADRLPMADSSADVVVAGTLLSSLRQPFLRLAVASEIGRVLRPGGRLVVYDIRYPSPRNASVAPITAARLRELFGDWRIEVRTITLLPPMARSRLAAGPRRYRLLSSIPALRSHLAAVLTKP
jgi:ubiquinone/menaquinone biosynthesis C-methylase UbiE